MMSAAGEKERRESSALNRPNGKIFYFPMKAVGAGNSLIPMSKVYCQPNAKWFLQTGEGKSSADWKLDPTELESKFNAKTKAIFLNNPNNPVGKV